MSAAPPPPPEPDQEPDTPPPWGTPESIPNNPITPLPRISGVIGDMIDAVSVAYQTPRDLPFLIILGILGICVGGRRRVRVAADWSEVLAIYAAVLVPSGERKSPVAAALLEPVHEAERRLIAKVEPSRFMLLAHRDVQQAAVDKIKRKGDASAEALADLDAALQRLAAIDVPSVPQLLSDDSTPEAMARIMADQDGRMGVVSTEAGWFATLAGRYSQGVPNLDLALKSWSGDFCRVDRISRDPVILPEPLLSIALAFQPAVLAGLAETRQFRGAGLLARWLYAIPASRVGEREMRPPPVPPSVATRYHEAIRDLAQLWSAETVNEMKLSDAAADTLHSFRADLERRMHPDLGDLDEIADWANKLPGQLVRIAALFTLVEDRHTGTVDDDKMSAAIGLGDYLIAHAKRAFAIMHGHRSTTEPPRAVYRWIMRKRLESFTVRDAWQGLRGQSWAETADDVREAIGALEEYGWVRRAPSEGGRGRPSEPYDVHPAAYTTDAPPAPTTDAPPAPTTGVI